MKEPDKKECIEFLEKEIKWFTQGGYDQLPYAKNRIRIIKGIKSILEGIPDAQEKEEKVNL